jgi:hypothetical protein
MSQVVFDMQTYVNKKPLPSLKVPFRGVPTGSVLTNSSDRPLDNGFIFENVLIAII